MKRRYRYGSYRGRTTARSVLKGLAVFLAALLVLLVLAVVFLEQYMVISGDGVTLDLPFLQREPVPTESLSPDSAPTPNLVIVTPEPTPAPAPQLHVAALPRACLSDGTAPARMAVAGANAVWFDMKADDGTLGFVSAQPLAIASMASASDPGLNAAIQAMNSTEGLYTVARVSCFKDDLLSNADRNLNILTNSGYLWTDPQKFKWTSPTSQAVRGYVAALCRELAELGFDEILLDNAGYPTEGNLGYIKPGPSYNRDQFTAVVGGFYTQVREALADYPDVKLSLVTTPAALDGTDAKSGQTAENVAEHAHRVWLSAAEEDSGSVARLLTDAGLEIPPGVLVRLSTAAGAEEENWAIWP